MEKYEIFDKTLFGGKNFKCFFSYNGYKRKGKVFDRTPPQKTLWSLESRQEHDADLK